MTTDESPSEIHRGRDCLVIIVAAVPVLRSWRPPESVPGQYAQPKAGQEQSGLRLRLPANEIVLLYDHGQDRRNLRLRTPRRTSSESSARDSDWAKENREALAN